MLFVANHSICFMLLTNFIAVVISVAVNTIHFKLIYFTYNQQFKKKVKTFEHM